MQKPDLKFIILTAFCVSIACAVAYIAYDIYSDAHRIVRDSEKTEHEVRSISKDAKEIFKEALEDRIEHHKK